MSARNAIALFVAVSTLALLVGCGGSSSPAANTVGFDKSSLNGTYVFSTTGVDNAGAFLAIAGTLVANGNGSITSGTMDVVGVEVTPPTPPATVAQPVTGSYSVGTDGRGQATLNSPGGPIKLDFVLTSTSHGLVTEYDGNGSGSGTIDMQSSVTLAQLGNSYAFSLAGVDNAGNSTATAGSAAFDTTGDVTGGVQDFNDDLIPFLALPILPGTVTLGTGTGPGSITLTTASFGTLTFDYYPIDATHLKLIETDYIQLLAGDALSQTGASIPQGSMVFSVAGLSVNGPVAAGGVMTSVDGAGTFTGGLEDVNDVGDVPPQLSFSGTPAAGASVGGRVIVNLSGFTPATQYVIYPSVAGVLMLETDPLAITSGVAFAQTSQTLAATNYGFNLSATNITNGLGAFFEEDDIAQFLTTSTTYTGIADFNDEGQTTPHQAVSGSFPNTPPVDATGRGVAISSNSPSFNFYVVDSSTVLLLETDTNQIGVGTFETQTTPSQPGVRKAINIVHPPAGRSHSALRRATKP
jgi:hypothetical protein